MASADSAIPATKAGRVSVEILALIIVIAPWFPWLRNGKIILAVAALSALLTCMSSHIQLLDTRSRLRSCANRGYRLRLLAEPMGLVPGVGRGN